MSAPPALAPVTGGAAQEERPPPSQAYKPIEGTLTTSRSASSSTHKRRISADTILDHEHLQRRETTKSLVIITLFILAFCICMAVVGFMQDWIGK